MMKKLFAILLAGILCLSCISAMAEDLDLSGITPTAALNESKGQIDEGKLKEVLPSLATMESKYTVDVTDEAVVVTFNQVQVKLDRIAGTGVLCLTPDFFASISDYSMFSDPTSMYENVVIGNDLIMYTADLYTNVRGYIYSQGTDSLTQLVGNLSSLSEKNAVSIAKALGFEKENLFSTANNTWLVWNTNAATIAGGEYIRIETANVETNEDLEALLEVLIVSDIK